MKKFHLFLAIVLSLGLAMSALPENTVQAQTASPEVLPPLPAPVQKVYDRTDKAVVEGRPGASWLWGPRVQDSQEEYQESTGGKRSVYYFEKGRLEITDPAKNPNDKYYITSGLLLREMITGKIQFGNNLVRDHAPANIPLAGDLTPGVADSPTYASLANLVSFDGSWKSSDITGQPVVKTLALGGAVTSKPELAQGIVHARYYPETGHNVAKPFVDFMNKSGTVYENGRYLNNQPLFDALYVFGFPISEPYWTNVTVGGKAQPVLVQAFERRLLTYTPANPEAYKVELGNLGLAYVQWRYKSAPAPVADVNFDPDYQKPTETEGFKLYNTANEAMRSLSALKRNIIRNGKPVSTQQFQAPDKARYLDNITYRGQPATLETIIAGKRTFQRLIVNNQPGNWFFEDSPVAFSWPAGFGTFRPVSLNEWTLDWKAGDPVKNDKDTFRPLIATLNDLTGDKIVAARLISEQNKVILNSTVETTFPDGRISTQTTAYGDYNVPNKIEAPAGARPAALNPSLAEAVDQPASGSRIADAWFSTELAGLQWANRYRKVAGGVLVKFKSGWRTERNPGGLRMAADWANTPGSLPVLYELNGADLTETLVALRANPAVEYAVPDYKFRFDLTQFNDPSANDQYYLKAVKMPRAWDFSTGSKGITVAVIDSGVDQNNPDLKGNIAETYNAQLENSDASDREGHGTWTTGIIAAVGNNNIYGTGLAWNSRILVARTDSDEEPGQSSTASVIRGLRYAADKGARVINLSLGALGDEVKAICAGVDYAVSKGVIVIASSGNDGSDQPHYPSNCNKVISVGATGLLGEPTSFSNYGGKVILSAPGVRICNTGLAGQFGCADGTSASAPIVSAAAALILSVNPALTSDQVKAILIGSATPAPGKAQFQRDDRYGYGQVNVATALRMAATNQIPLLPPDYPK